MTSSKAVTFSLLSNMVLSTPSVSAATGAEMAATAVADPAAYAVAALTVAKTSESGADADAASWANAAATVPPERVTP
jgi:hypothetical protein